MAGMNASVISDEAVLNRSRQWLERAVIGLNLCPFAKSVHIKGQIRWVVSRAQTPQAVLDELVSELRHLAAVDPEVTDTTLLVLPDAFADFLDFNDFLDVADAALEDLALDGVLQIANFHPNFQFADTAEDDVTNNTNRAPWPTLHLIREASIDRAVEAFPEAETIYERNMALMSELGSEGWARLWDEKP
jgi:hypothetical protein